MGYDAAGQGVREYGDGVNGSRRRSTPSSRRLRTPRARACGRSSGRGSRRRSFRQVGNSPAAAFSPRRFRTENTVISRWTSRPMNSALTFELGSYQCLHGRLLVAVLPHGTYEPVRGVHPRREAKRAACRWRRIISISRAPRDSVDCLEEHDGIGTSESDEHPSWSPRFSPRSSRSLSAVRHC